MNVINFRATDGSLSLKQWLKDDACEHDCNRQSV